MIKLILLAIAVFVVYQLIKNYGRNMQKPEPPDTKGPEDMVCCAHCGVHLPMSESILSSGKYFCSDEHRKLHQD